MQNIIAKERDSNVLSISLPVTRRAALDAQSAPRTPIASVGPAVSDELKSHGLRTDIYPAEDAFFMRPLISAMATALAKHPPRTSAVS